MSNYSNERIKKTAKTFMNEVIKATKKSSNKKIFDFKKLEADYWVISPLSKKIERAVITYLNERGLNSEPQSIDYLNGNITVFTITPEAVINMKNSPEEYNPSHYLILHKRKDRKERWRMWLG